jgi:hypothetical protein
MEKFPDHIQATVLYKANEQVQHILDNGGLPCMIISFTEKGAFLSVMEEYSKEQIRSILMTLLEKL